MAKRTYQISPAGRALFPKLKDADTKFKPEGEYVVRLILSEDDAAPLLAMCEEMQGQAAEEEFQKQREAKPKMKPEKIREGIKMADLPVKKYEDPETGEETGEYQATFKMTASGVSKKTGKPWTRRPALFDALNKPVDPKTVDVWTGSILKVSYNPDPFCTAIGAGVSLRLEAVQIIDLVSGGARDASDYGFAADEEGYAHEDSGSPFPSDEDLAAAGAPDTGETDF